MKLTRDQWRVLRGVLYGISLAGMSLLTYYGVVPAEAAPLWLGFAAALLNLNPKQDA